MDTTAFESTYHTAAAKLALLGAKAAFVVGGVKVAAVAAPVYGVYRGVNYLRWYLRTRSQAQVMEHYVNTLDYDHERSPDFLAEVPEPTAVAEDPSVNEAGAAPELPPTWLEGGDDEVVMQRNFPEVEEDPAKPAEPVQPEEPAEGPTEEPSQNGAAPAHRRRRRKGALVREFIIEGKNRFGTPSRTPANFLAVTRFVVQCMEKATVRKCDQAAIRTTVVAAIFVPCDKDILVAEALDHPVLSWRFKRWLNTAMGRGNC
jgi:hypothetical protein